MITVKELLKAAGISRSTLTLWQSRGLVPTPQTAKAPSGPGQVGYWPDDTLQTIAFIKDRQAQGLSLDQIAQLLERRNSVTIGQVSAPVLAAIKRFDEARVTRRVWASADDAAKHAWQKMDVTVREALRIDIENELVGEDRDTFVSEVFARTAASAAVSDERLGWGLFLASIGYLPVLVCGRAFAPAVVPDFVAGEELSGTGAAMALKLMTEAYRSGERGRELEYSILSDAMRLIVPLFRLYEQACKAAGVTALLPDGPQIFPASIVEVVRRKPDGSIDAALQTDYALFPITPGPYGWLGFTLLPRTARTVLGDVSQVATVSAAQKKTKRKTRPTKRRK